MQYYSEIMRGLWTTIGLSLISLFIGIVPGAILYLGKRSKIKIIYFICTAYIEVFRGIPLLAQLFVLYYALPVALPVFTFSSLITAVVVLSLNTIAYIPSIARTYKDRNEGDSEVIHMVKLLTLSAVEVFGKLVKYSTLLSYIAVSELLRVAHTIVTAEHDVVPIIVVIVIYLLISIATKLITKILYKSFFSGEAVPYAKGDPA